MTPCSWVESIAMRSSRVSLRAGASVGSRVACIARLLAPRYHVSPAEGRDDHDRDLRIDPEVRWENARVGDVKALDPMVAEIEANDARRGIVAHARAAEHVSNG